ncbi:MAG TPA: zf-HC2 domain-containing protein [Bryobacteraceae bacterium]|nr:zf-HC2 domain-containing protein [Bryobacteraceae bacterium]
MDHKEAIRIQAVDRYLLGELSSVDRQDFEEHFFSCGECSEDLRIGAILVGSSRAVLREEPPDPVTASPRAALRRPGWSGWWPPIPMTAAIALLVLVGYQNLMVIPGYRRQVAEGAGAAVPPRVAVRPAVRGAIPVVSLPKGTRFFEIEAEEVEPAAGGYDCTIRDSRGRTITGFHAPPAESGGKLRVLLDTHQTPAGQYVLLVRKSGGDAEMGQYPFAIEMH